MRMAANALLRIIAGRTCIPHSFVYERVVKIFNSACNTILDRVPS